MSKKQTFKKTAALLLGIALTVGGTSCTFLTTDNEKDLAQVVATVNISESLKADETYGSYAGDVEKLISNMSTDILKRDLVSYYLSTGYSYVQSGYTAKDTFNMLMDNLVNRKIITQHAVAYYVKNAGLSADGCAQYVETQLNAANGKEKELLQAHPEVLTLKYILTEGGKAEEQAEYDKAVYSLKSSLNSSLDSYESSYIVAEDEEHSHNDGRTTPNGVGTEKEDYYPVNSDGSLNYDIYTGRNALSACGVYEKVDGSTTTSRQKAYNAFIANVSDYGLISEDEDTKDVTLLDYYYVELSTTLGQALIGKYYEDLQDAAVAGMTDDYVSNKYSEILEAQKYAYKGNATAFESAIGGVSDDSFVLYGEAGFGFVYNILIPFSAKQNNDYTAAKNKGLTQNEIYIARKDIATNIQAKDLRGDWFDVHDHANNAYEVTEGYYDNHLNKGETTYLFFEDSVSNTDRYESLTQYAGKYPYNGVAVKEDHEFEFTPNKLSIDQFIAEMESYINYTVGGNVANGKLVDTYNTDSYINSDNSTDYSKFMYYAGKVNLKNTSASDYFKAENNDAYAALSAVNELMFAYSTDTGCLNTYMGYAVNPIKTNFVSEFEYAAQYAVSQGVGSYVVCLTDYGWHVIYTTFVYDGGDVYGGYNVAEKEVEGSFSNMFYESLKATTATTYTNELQSEVLNQFNNDDCVTRFEKRYKDLLEIQ